MAVSAEPAPAFRASVARLLNVDASTLGFRALSGGVSSDIWRVDTPRATYCAKRALPRLNVAALWEVSTRRNAEEVRWLRTVRAWIGDQAAQVVAADEDEGIAVLAWYDPARWRNWKAELLRGRIDVAVARRLGDLVGMIARRAAAEPGLADRFDNGDLFDALRIDPFFRCLRPDTPRLQTLIAQLQNDRATLVHGDFSPKNILVDEAGEVRILDAECATWGTPGFDPGYLLAHLLLKLTHTGNPALRDAAIAFWTAYRRSAGGCLMDLDQRTYLPLAGMLLARVDGKSPVEYLTAPQRDRVRQQAMALLRQQMVPIDILLQRWPPV